jgi:hypothetical protein
MIAELRKENGEADVTSFERYSLHDSGARRENGEADVISLHSRI